MSSLVFFFSFLSFLHSHLTFHLLISKRSIRAEIVSEIFHPDTHVIEKKAVNINQAPFYFLEPSVTSSRQVGVRQKMFAGDAARSHSSSQPTSRRLVSCRERVLKFSEIKSFPRVIC